MSDELFDEILAKEAEVPFGLARRARLVCRGCAAADGEEASLQEAQNFLAEVALATDEEEVLMAAEGWAVRGPKGLEWLRSPKGLRFIAEVWSHSR